jgi:hypothetical protein
MGSVPPRINPANDELSPDRVVQSEVILVRVPGGRHRAADRSAFGRLENALQSLPVAVRVAVLVLVLTGTAAIEAAAGFAGQLLLALVGCAIGYRRC